jgi:Cu/Ag efflux protein CusF
MFPAPVASTARDAREEECVFMSKRLFTLVAAVAAVFVAGVFSTAAAQKPVAKGVVVSETAVIQAIDHNARLVTLKSEDGVVDTVYCGPEVKRFNELKVGDKVVFRYHESMVLAIQAPGTKAPVSEASGITRRETGKPGGTISEQMTAVVTVLAVDLKAPSITIQTADGIKMSFGVEDKKNLEGVKVGDKIQITYTQALAISVEPGS